MDAQEEPVQPSPAIRWPIQRPPFQAVPFLVAVAHVAGVERAEDVASPDSVALLSHDVDVPRAASSEPRPVDTPVLTVTVGLAVFSAVAMFSSPTRRSALAPVSGFAELRQPVP